MGLTVSDQAARQPVKPSKESYSIVSQIAAVRKPINAQVRERERGLCIACGKLGTEVHEIEQRSHHPRDQQIEAGTFSLENCVLVCRKCHQDIGQGKFGEMLFKYLLFARYGGRNSDYARPNLWI